MGEPAKVTKLPTQERPDLSKPVSLYYWTLPNGQHFGNSTNRMAMVGGQFQDGEGTSGKVTEILFYPSGALLIEVQPHALVGVKDPDDALIPKKYVLCMGTSHGAMLAEDTAAALRKAGRL